MKSMKLIFSALLIRNLGIFAASSSWASTISGTATNNSGKSCRVNIVQTGQFGDTGLGTAVTVNSGFSAPYTVYASVTVVIDVLALNK